MIDYTRNFWGHACTIKRTDRTQKDGTPIFKGHCFSSQHVEEGTEFTLAMQSGRVAVFTVTAVTDHPHDPGDMYFIEAVPTRYEDGND